MALKDDFKKESDKVTPENKELTKLIVKITEDGLKAARAGETEFFVDVFLCFDDGTFEKPWDEARFNQIVNWCTQNGFTVDVRFNYNPGICTKHLYVKWG